MNESTLMWKSAKRAFGTSGNLITGGLSVLASGVALNPLPFILWALGSAGWVTVATASGRYVREVAEEEHAERIARAARERDELRQRIAQVFVVSPFDGWVRSGAIPDYLTRYDHLLDIRRRIAQITRGRSHGALVPDDQVTDQLDRMLAAFLKLVWSRITYLQILTGERVAPGVLSGSAPERPSRLQRFLAFFQEDDDPVLVDRTFGDPDRRSVRGRRLDLRAAADAVDEKIALLQRRMAEEPATREILGSNVKLLERQRVLLEQTAARDARVGAQLDAFSDAFDLILSQVSATQYDSAGVVEYMDSLATQVADTEEFVAAMQPVTDDLLSEVALATESGVLQ